MGCKESTLAQASPDNDSGGLDDAARKKLEHDEATCRCSMIREYCSTHPLAPKTIASSPLLLVIIHGVVYDCTSFASAHPGGPYILMKNRGSDVGSTFDRIHSRTTKRFRLSQLHVGRVVEDEEV